MATKQHSTWNRTMFQSLAQYAKGHSPAYVLGCILILAIEWELHWFAASVSTNINSYVVTSGEGLKQLNSSMAVVHETHAALAEYMDILASMVEQNGERIARVEKDDERLLALFEHAQQMMARSPEDRARQIALLEDIKGELQKRGGVDSIP